MQSRFETADLPQPRGNNLRKEEVALDSQAYFREPYDAFMHQVRVFADVTANGHLKPPPPRPVWGTQRMGKAELTSE